MKNITKINLLNQKAEQITVFDSDLTRFLDRNNINVETAMIKVCTEVPKDKNQEENETLVKSALDAMCVQGYTLNNVTFKPFMASASDVRKATATWFDETITNKVGTWAVCGLNPAELKLAVNKYMAYLGLLSSASKPFTEVFGRKIDIRRVAVIRDAEVIVNAVVDLVTMSKVSNKQNRELKINAFDGFGIVNRVMTKGESCTIRGPWLKAFLQAAKWDEIAAWCKKNNIKPEFNDFWGNTVKLEDVDMILTESCFKTIKLYKSWEQYQTAFEKLGHEISVCVREHAPKLKGMPYQQGQTLLGTEDDAAFFAMHAKKTVYKYQSNVKKAADLLTGWQRAAAKIYPSLLNEVHTARTMQEKYTTKRLQMLGGRIPELGYNAFIAPDMVAFVQHLFGQKITGFLKPCQCACESIEAGDTDVTRNPHLDNAHVILSNVVKMPFVCGTPTMFLNIFDTTTIQLRCDYDGDHVWYSQHKYLLDLIQRTYRELGNLPIDWDVEGSPKTMITRSAIKNFICNLLHGSEIGLYADALTKMWNSGYNRFVCDWLTYAGNVLIDAAKHASVKIVKPDAVTKLADVSLPEFAKYAKATEEHPWNDPYWTALKSDRHPVPRTAYSGSFLDMYSRKVKENVPETLKVEGAEDLLFDSTKLLINPKRPYGRLTGLTRKGSYDALTGTNPTAGVFQKIAFRHAEDWNKVVAAGETMRQQEWEEAKAASARKEIIDWVKAQYQDMVISDDKAFDAAYDIIARNIFTSKLSEGMDTVVKQCFWRVFGEKACEVLSRNLDSRIPDFDSPEFAELFDTTDD